MKIDISISKAAVAKHIVAAVVGLGTSRIVSGIIKNNVTPEKRVDKALIFIASYVLGSMIVDMATNYTNKKIDGIIEQWEKAKSANGIV